MKMNVSRLSASGLDLPARSASTMTFVVGVLRNISLPQIIHTLKGLLQTLVPGSVMSAVFDPMERSTVLARAVLMRMRTLETPQSVVIVSCL